MKTIVTTEFVYDAAGRIVRQIETTETFENIKSVAKNVTDEQTSLELAERERVFAKQEEAFISGIKNIMTYVPDKSKDGEV